MQHRLLVPFVILTILMTYSLTGCSDLEVDEEAAAMDPASFTGLWRRTQTADVDSCFGEPTEWNTPADEDWVFYRVAARNGTTIAAYLCEVAKLCVDDLDGGTSFSLQDTLWISEPTLLESSSVPCMFYSSWEKMTIVDGVLRVQHFSEEGQSEIDINSGECLPLPPEEYQCISSTISEYTRLTD